MGTTHLAQFERISLDPVGYIAIAGNFLNSFKDIAVSGEATVPIAQFCEFAGRSKGTTDVAEPHHRAKLTHAVRNNDE